MDEIIFTHEKQIGVVTLNRVQALNSLTLTMIIALQDQLLAWEQDDSIYAVIVRAAPGKAFCAGGDVRWLYETGRTDKAQQLQFFWHEYRLNHYIHRFSKPYIVLMDGVCMGGGVGISLHGSHPVATERFLFAMPETGIGFFPDIGASYLLARCPTNYGIYLGLTGNRLNAEDAQALGLVNYVIRSDKITAVFEQLIAQDLSTDAHARVDECLQRFASPVKAVAIMELQDNISSCFMGPDMESILIALEDGKETWHLETLDCLEQKSPLSLKVTLAQLQKARTMSLAACVEMDYCLAGHFMTDHDFYEGVRALLIDKDKSPQWQPPTLAEVSEEKISDYFIGDVQSLSL